MGTIEDARTQVLVVTADERLASLLRQALQSYGSFVCCGCASDAKDARALPATISPDVIVADADLGDGAGAPVAHALLEEYPDTPTVVVAERMDHDMVREMIRRGAHAVLVSDTSADVVPQAIERALDGRLTLSDAALELIAVGFGRQRPLARTRASSPRSLVDSAAWEAAATLADEAFFDLTPREKQVMSELAYGNDNRTIGRHLGVGTGTVSKHITHLRQKFGAANRRELMTISARVRIPT